MAATTHNAPEFKHPDEMDWEMGRFRNVTKFLFHPTPERPTTPNVGFLRYEPGAGFPLHKHDFAQIWYVIEGEFQMGEKTYGPGTIVYMEDPHFENEMRTETGGTVLFVQYPGPTTGAPADLRRPHEPQRQRRRPRRSTSSTDGITVRRRRRRPRQTSIRIGDRRVSQVTARAAPVAALAQHQPEAAAEAREDAERAADHAAAHGGGAFEAAVEEGRARGERHRQQGRGDDGAHQPAPQGEQGLDQRRPLSAGWR